MASSSLIIIIIPIHGSSSCNNTNQPRLFLPFIDGVFLYLVFCSLATAFPISSYSYFNFRTSRFLCYIVRVATSSTSRCLHLNSSACTQQCQTGFIHFTTTWTHGFIFFDHYYNPNSRFFSLQCQPRLFPALYRWCFSLPGFLFFGYCVSYSKLQLFLFSYKSVSLLYRSGRYFFF
jgi:hypothetical protein